MIERLERLVRVSAAEWPERAGAAKAGDLSLWIPEGLGMGGPTVLFPWDDLAAVGQRASYYGFQAPTANPIRNAPLTNAAGGVVYFDDGPEAADLEAMLRLLGVQTHNKHYGVFARESENPQEDGYITQVRIVSRFALANTFRALSSEEYERFPEQPLRVGELVPAFVNAEHEHWGGGWPESSSLEGCMGGDGDFARESLAFGFLVENGFQGVYRIWSRAWLVTK